MCEVFGTEGGRYELSGATGVPTSMRLPRRGPLALFGRAGKRAARPAYLRLSVALQRSEKESQQREANVLRVR